MTALTDEVTQRLNRAKRNRRNQRVGGDYEVRVAKKIAAYCGELEWSQAFVRNRPSLSVRQQHDGRTERLAGAQTNGDLTPIKEMAQRWMAAGLGVLECKHEEDWSFTTLLLHPEKSTLTRYWRESNLNTGTEDSLIFFTKTRAADYVLHPAALGVAPPCLRVEVAEGELVMRTLVSFLILLFPEFAPKP